MTLALDSGVTIDNLSFGVRITPNGSAPALTGSLSFNNSLAAPPTFALPSGSDAISVAWLTLFNPALSGTVAVGSIAMTIPDHVDILCRLEQGGQLRFTDSSVIGHAPGLVFTIYGTEGTIRIEGGAGDMSISAGRKGDAGLSPVEIADDKRGGWRVEEEFINAIRGTEPVTHTDFYTGVRYMEWTDAVTRSLRTGELVNLPLDAN